nr:SH3 domain-containing protein [Bacteroidia bacterium]
LWLTFGLAAAYLFSGKVFIRKIMFFSTLTMLLFALFTWKITHSQYKHLKDHKAAVVFAESEYVKSSPDEKSANLFMLHSGTRLEVLDTLQGWKKVRIANGNEGWITDHAIVII